MARRACCPDSTLRASAGWLLEQTGFLPGARVGPGVYCSRGRALTLTARDDATAADFTTALEVLAHAVLTTHRIRLRPEPVQSNRRSPSHRRHPPFGKRCRS
ncbi:hypothetical protein ACH4TC_00865 [Streptomyces spororaveus]|uniref:hypothetical protein n=1 Tax=Streptomyces spororaveus TaxID=284039 RepID=UPI0037A84E64